MHRGKIKHQKPNVEKKLMLGTFSDMCQSNNCQVLKIIFLIILMKKMLEFQKKMWRTVFNCLQTRIAFSCLIDTRYFAAIDRSLLKRLRSFVRATRAFISVAAAATKVLQRFVRFFRPFNKFSESLPS